MADEIDRANDTAEAATDRAIAEARALAVNIPAGTAGDCSLCGSWTGRLVKGACAPCRDTRGLP